MIFSSSNPIGQNMADRTFMSDMIVGVAIMLVSSFIWIVYVIVLRTIWKDAELIKLTSYKFMFLLGLFDSTQCIPHFITGLFTIFQTTWHPILAKFQTLGIVATPCYVGFCVMTLILSLQRLAQLTSKKLNAFLFNGWAVYGWCGIGVFYWAVMVIFLALPESAIKYNPKLYSWSYDDTLEYSKDAQEFEMLTEVSTVIISGVLYVFVVLLLLRRRKQFTTSANYATEIKIIIQAGTITIYSFVLSIVWHNYKLFLPENLWVFMSLNFMWIVSPAVYPIIYLVVNSALRGKIVKRQRVPRTPSARVHILESRTYTPGPTMTTS